MVSNPKIRILAISTAVLPQRDKNDWDMHTCYRPTRDSWGSPCSIKYLFRYFIHDQIFTSRWRYTNH